MLHHRSLWTIASTALAAWGGLIPTNAYADTLEVGDTSAGAVPGAAVTLPLSLAQGGAAGMQFDLVFSSGQVEAGGAILAAEGTNHRAESREVSEGRRRVVVVSRTNAALPAGLAVEIPLELGESFPSGGPSLSVENLIFTDAAGDPLPASVAYPAIEQWRRDHFTEAERANPEIVGDDRDADGDGAPNLAEFLAGTNPRSNLSVPSARAERAEGPGGERLLTLTWREAKSAAPAARVVPEISSNLEDWAEAANAVSPTGDEDADSVEMRAAVEVGPTGRQFLRLKFLRTQP